MLLPTANRFPVRRFDFGDDSRRIGRIVNKFSLSRVLTSGGADQLRTNGVES